MNHDDFLHHTCHLEAMKDIVEMNTPPGIVYKARLFWRRFTMSSDTCNLAKLYFKSNYMLRYDRKRQFTMYYWSIHPLSDMVAVWEDVYGVLFCLFILLLPFCLLFPRSNWAIIATVLQLCFVIDFLLRFFAGYVEKKTKKIILEKRKIFVHYLATFLIIDFLSCLPMRILARSVTGKRLANILPVLKMLRIMDIRRYLSDQQIRHNFPSLVAKIIGLCFLYFASIWTYFCVMSIVRMMDSKLFEDANIDKTKLCVDFYRAIYIILLAGIPLAHTGGAYYIPPDLISIGLVGGCFLRFIIVALFLQVVSGSKSPDYRYKCLLQELEDFSKAKHLPPYMHKRLKTYYAFKYQNRFYNKHTIDYALTDQLLKQIKMTRMRKLVSQIDIFANIPSLLFVDLVMAFDIEYLLSNDVVTEYGKPCDALFIIASGSVAIFNGRGQEMCHLEDGCYFGELNLIFNTDFCSFSSIAISSAELYVLSKDTFHHILRRYKHELNKMISNAQQKLQRAFRAMELRSYDFMPPVVMVDEIFDDLRRVSTPHVMH